MPYYVIFYAFLFGGIISVWFGVGLFSECRRRKRHVWTTAGVILTLLGASAIVVAGNMAFFEAPLLKPTQMEFAVKRRQGYDVKSEYLPRKQP